MPSKMGDFQSNINNPDRRKLINSNRRVVAGRTYDFKSVYQIYVQVERNYNITKRGVTYVNQDK